MKLFYDREKRKRGKNEMKNIKNNLFMLRIIWSAAPKRILWELLSVCASCSIGMIYTLFFLRFIIVCMEQKLTFSLIIVCIVGYFAACVVSSCCSVYLKQVVVPQTNVLIQSKLMDLIYQQALRVDLSCYENPKFYDTYTQANEEVLTRTTEILGTMSFLVEIIVSMIGFGTAVLIYEPFILPFLIVSMLIVQTVQRKFVDARYTRRKKTVGERRKMDYVKRIVYLQDYAKDLRLTNIFSPILRNFHEAAESSRMVSKKYGKRAGIYRIFSSMISSLTVFLGIQGIIIYRYLVLNQYSFGVLTTVLNAASALDSCLSDLIWAAARLNENGVFIQNFREFLTYQPKMVEKPDGIVPQNGAHELELKGVSFWYEGAKKPVLHNINMKILAGQKIALVGHNGAGKSTLVKLFMRLYDVSEGEILLDGVNIKEYHAKGYRRLFGTIFQDFKVFAATVTENVLLKPITDREEEEQAKKALQESGIYEKIKSFPNGMNRILTKEFDEDGILMSGGESQKLAIARVFAKESSIAILDEPSSALDPISEYEIFENMMEACKGKTVIFVSHRLSSATLADRVYLLEKGEIVEEGSHQELMEQNGKYAQMFLKQAEKYREEETA